MSNYGPVRNRIVINLGGGKPVAAGNRPRLWPKVLAFLAAFLIVLIVLAIGGAFLWWRHYQATPAYSLALMIDAANSNEMDAFDKRIDDEKIAAKMVSKVSEKAAGRYGLALSGSLQSEVTRLVPTLLPDVKQTIHEELARDIREFASKSESKPFIILALAIPAFVTITTEGDVAKASATLSDREISLGLQRDGSLWKIVEVDDDVLVQRIVDNVIKEMPAIGGNKLNLLPGTSKKAKKR